MFETEYESWLVECLDARYAGLALDSSGCQRLGRGFVGCNLAANLCEFFTGIGNNWPGCVFGGHAAPSYAQLCAWLLEPPATWQDLANLTSASAAVAMTAGPHLRDPWWQINRWLGIESFLRIVGLTVRLAATGPTPSVLGYAQEVARRVLPRNALEPAACNCQGETVSHAFDDWWQAATAELVDLWRQQSWHEQTHLNRHTVGHLLALDVGKAGTLLVRLVGTKNNQASACIRALNDRIAGPAPLPDGWMERLASQVLDAWTAGDDFTFSTADLEHLNALGRWLAGPRLAPLRQPLHTVFSGFPSPPTSPAVFPGPELAGVVGVLNDISRESPRRGLPLDWSSYQVVPDLFFYPVRPGCDFGRWGQLLNVLDGIPPLP